MSLDFCHSGLSGPQTEDILRGNQTSSQPWMFTGNLLLFSNQIKTLYRIFSVWICIMPSSQSPSLQGELDCCLIEQPVIRFLWPKINSNYSTRQRTSTRRHAETYRRVKSRTFFKESRVEIKKNLPVSRCSETQMSSALCCDYSFTTAPQTVTIVSEWTRWTSPAAASWKTQRGEQQCSCFTSSSPNRPTKHSILTHSCSSESQNFISNSSEDVKKSETGGQSRETKCFYEL